MDISKTTIKKIRCVTTDNGNLMFLKCPFDLGKGFGWDAEFEVLPESLIAQDKLSNRIGGQSNLLKGCDGRSFDTDRPVQGIVDLPCASFNRGHIDIAVVAALGSHR